MIARITEAWAAAPTPCRKRAPISAPSLGARPHSSEATVKMTRPVSKTRLRPARSPRRPASSSRLPKVMRKALTTQVRPAWLKWRSCWIEGSATFTIVTSSTIISWARQTTMSAAQRRWSMEGAGAETTVIGVPRTCAGADRALKWRAPPKRTGGFLRNYTEAPSGLSSDLAMSTAETPAETSLARPKRADARRNYEKVLVAAREAFAEGGESTALEEIARRAGVGIGTLYRNFPNRQALLEALYIDEVEEVCRTAAQLDDGDPWQALNDWLERFIGYIGTKRALAAQLHHYLGHDASPFHNRPRLLPSPG